ncbi:hypothetical protein [Dysgonomonas sp. 520]|uniref:hypothetical protein n=1 Tax=Dysgonomonas sp. 520 TaxID=2302931 RepID=UPI0013D2C270|nr:hypothetical protein [Dysgonomonas sp. 520]NDW08759.1 hypothetical protein [Dysgonomonas sp. 520]
MATWTKTNDYYNREVVKEDVWSRKCRRGRIYVIDKTPFTYTFSCGANSDFSHTGCFFRHSKITTVEQAMNVIDIIADRWLIGQEYSALLEKYK